MTEYPRRSPGAHFNGLIRKIPTLRRTGKTYVFNYKFKIIKNKKYYNLLTGKLNFTGYQMADEFKTYTHYRSIGWLNFAHTGVIIEIAPKNNGYNLEEGLYRLTCARKPDTPGFEEQMQLNQNMFVRNYSTVLLAYIRLNLGYHSDYHSETYDDMLIMRNKPHAKHEVYRNAFDQMEVSGQIGGIEHIMEHSDGKGKPGEEAKVGKYHRMIVDYGPNIPVVLVEACNTLKEWFGSTTFTNNNCTFKAITSPEPEKIMDHIEFMNNSGSDFDMMSYSDDVVCKDKGEFGGKFNNCDLESNDQCPRGMLIELFFEFFGFTEIHRNVLRNCILAPIKIANPLNKKYRLNEYFMLKPYELMEGSGIPCTALMNFFAWFCIWFMKTLHPEYTTNKCANLIGYSCSYDVQRERHILEDIQFLKQSPCWGIKEGERLPRYHLTPNLGIIAKVSGVRKGDYPQTPSRELKKLGLSRKDDTVEFRAKYHQTGVMNGLLHGVNYPPINRLNPSIHDNIYLSPDAQDYHIAITKSSKVLYTRDYFYRRYNLESWEIDELESFIANNGYGVTIYSSAIDKILFKDYGLNVPFL